MLARLDASLSLLIFALVMGLLSTRAHAGYPDIAPACGSKVTVMLDEPLITTFPLDLQHKIMAALLADILTEGRAFDACYEGQTTDCEQLALSTSLHLHRLLPATSDRQLYLVWWWVPLLCGSHENCPIWLVEVGPGGARNLVQKATGQNPGRTLDSGWGVTVLPDKKPLSRLMIVRPTYSGGRATAIGSCWRENDNGYKAEPCPAICDAELDKQSTN